MKKQKTSNGDSETKKEEAPAQEASWRRPWFDLTNLTLHCVSILFLSHGFIPLWIFFLLWYGLIAKCLGLPNYFVHITSQILFYNRLSPPFVLPFIHGDINRVQVVEVFFCWLHSFNIFIQTRLALVNHQLKVARFCNFHFVDWWNSFKVWSNEILSLFICCFVLLKFFVDSLFTEIVRIVSFAYGSISCICSNVFQ